MRTIMSPLIPKPIAEAENQNKMFEEKNKMAEQSRKIQFEFDLWEQTSLLKAY